MRVLACDGGGVRGILSARWLLELERIADLGPVGRAFDLVAGTSTGALLACGVGLGIPCDDLVDFYLQRSGRVFPSRWRRIASRFGRLLAQGLSAPRYSPAALEEELRAVFGEARLGELRPKTMVFAYNVQLGKPVVWKSWRHPDVLVWQACLASSSAPTYFPGVVVDGAPIVDGGVAANNPAAAALAETVRLGAALWQVHLLSLGTGASWRAITEREIRRWGLGQWAPHLASVLMDGPNEVADYICAQVLGRRYTRLQVVLPDALAAMDNAGNAAELAAIAENTLRNGQRAALESFWTGLRAT